MELVPRLRGVSHQLGFFVALGAGAVLTATAASLPVAIYAVTLAAMLGVSASYHRGRWRPRAELRWRRADHATIFAFIAGSYTPFCALAIGGSAGARLLALVWLGAGLGVLRALFWVDAPRWITAASYLAVGWVVVAALPELAAVGAPVLVPLVIGGLLYSAGAAVYALRRPDPAPEVFGYHEVFHVLVLAGALAHFVAILRLVG
jgi:hemolysin III